MALSDLLRAIEADAHAERERAEGRGNRRAAAVVRAAHTAGEQAPGGTERCTQSHRLWRMRSTSAPSPAWTQQAPSGRRVSRRSRSLVAGIGAALGSLRDSARLSEALPRPCSPKALLRCRRRGSCGSTRAMLTWPHPLPTVSTSLSHSTAGAASSSSPTTDAPSGTRWRNASKRRHAAATGSRSGSRRHHRSARCGLAMRLPAGADFAYGNTRLRARRSELLDASDYQRLLDLDLDALLDTLQRRRTRPRQRTTRANDPLRSLHEVIARHLAAHWRTCVPSTAAERASWSTCCCRASTSHNLIAVLRARAARARRVEDALAALIPVGWLTSRLLARWSARLNWRSWSTFSPLGARPRSGVALRRSFAQYERTQDLPRSSAPSSATTPRGRCRGFRRGPDADTLLRARATRDR